MTPRKPTRAKALGIDDAEYARLLAAQGGHCALCPNTPKTEHDPTKAWRCRYCKTKNIPDRAACVVCGKARPAPSRLHVDHDHATGKVRGLLCYVCNKYLPASRDADWHRRVADYLDAEKTAEAMQALRDGGLIAEGTRRASVDEWRKAIERGWT